MKVVIFYAFLILVTVFAFYVPSGRAESIDTLRSRIRDREAEINKIEAEIAIYQKSLDAQSSLSKSLKNETTKLETQIKKLNADIRLAQFQIQKAELTISELNGTIDEKERAIIGERNSLAELIRIVDESDGQSLVEILFAYGSIADFFGEQDANDRLYQSVASELQILKGHKETLISERDKKIGEEKNLEMYKKDLSGRKAANESINQEKSKLLRDSKNQESKYQKLLREREERRALVQKEMDTIEDQLKLLIDPTSLPAKGKGILAWPVKNPYITQGFGFTDFATTYGAGVYNGKGHNGVDFRAPIGTQILAAEAGVVKDTGNTDIICPGGSYGKWVIIEHAGNLSTLYGHLSSISIAKGAQVTRGQVMGYSGETGYATGPHVHLTVYASNTYRLYKTKNCGLVPAGGYINPLDYL